MALGLSGVALFLLGIQQNPLPHSFTTDMSGSHGHSAFNFLFESMGSQPQLAEGTDADLSMRMKPLAPNEVRIVKGRFKGDGFAFYLVQIQTNYLPFDASEAERKVSEAHAIPPTASKLLSMMEEWRDSSAHASVEEKRLRAEEILDEASLTKNTPDTFLLLPLKTTNKSGRQQFSITHMFPFHATEYIAYSMGWKHLDSVDLKSIDLSGSPEGFEKLRKFFKRAHGYELVFPESAIGPKNSFRTFDFDPEQWLGGPGLRIRLRNPDNNVVYPSIPGRRFRKISGKVDRSIEICAQRAKSFFRGQEH